MKGEIMPAIVKIDRAHLEELMYEVKETLATDLLNTNRHVEEKVFCAIDLWKIQRNYKSAHLRFKSIL
jgi:hypothetical protein